MQPQEFLSHWQQVRAGLLETSAKFEDADLGYAPFPGGMSVAELLLHIAHEERGEICYGITMELNEWPPAYDPADYPSVVAITNLLTEVHQHTESYLVDLPVDALDGQHKAPWGGTMVLGEAVWHVLDHELHHRGELSLILGLLGREGLDA